MALFLLATPAETTAQAREHFKAAQLHYALGEFEDAVKEFREAYRLRQEPAILYNIAQCHRQMRQWREAYFNYRQYLNLKRDAPNRDEVEELVEQMRRRMDDEEEQKTRIARDPVPVHSEAVLPQAPPPVVAPEPSPLFSEKAQPPARSSLRYAGYGALAAGAVAEGLAFVFHSSAQSSADQFNQKYQSGQLTAADGTLRDDASSKGKLATFALFGGAVLIATGAALCFAF